TSVSSGTSGGIRTGFGIGANFMSPSNTLGRSSNYNFNEQNTKISLIDINGDGLPDKVYANNSTVYYRPNTGVGFGSLLTVNGINKLTKVKSRTRGSGYDANIFGFGVGKSKSTTRSETDDYFVDFNGDGLPDMITGGRVKFNISNNVNNYLVRNFGQNVAQTE